MRFLQQDTVLGNIEDPLSRNLYAYGQGNPVNYTDPSGHLIVADELNNVYYNPQTQRLIFNNGEIQPGDKGQKVREIQTMLISLKNSRYGLPKYGADGDFGGETTKAVNNFKNDRKINNTGIWKGVVDQKTRSTLVDASKKMFDDGSGVFVDAKKDTKPVQSPPVEGKGKPSLTQRLTSMVSGSFMVYLGVTAMIVGATAFTIATGGAGSYALFSAVVAAGTILSGAGLTAMGVNEIAYGATGHNFVLDKVFDGDVEAYSTTQFLFTMGTTAGVQYSSAYVQVETIKNSAQGNTVNTSSSTTESGGQNAQGVNEQKLDQPVAGDNVGIKLRHENSKYLLESEGQVGTYQDLIDSGKRGDNITPHHMPSAKYMQTNYNIGKNKGVAMNMEHPHPGIGGRHRLTITYGMSGEKLRDYTNLSPRDALARDISNVRSIYINNGLYNETIRQGLIEVIRMNKELFLDLFNK